MSCFISYGLCRFWAARLKSLPNHNLCREEQWMQPRFRFQRYQKGNHINFRWLRITNQPSKRPWEPPQAATYELIVKIWCAKVCPSPSTRMIWAYAFWVPLIATGMIVHPTCGLFCDVRALAEHQMVNGVGESDLILASTHLCGKLEYAIFEDFKRTISRSGTFRKHLHNDTMQIHTLFAVIWSIIALANQYHMTIRRIFYCARPILCVARHTQCKR